MSQPLPLKPWRADTPFTPYSATPDLIVACSDGRFARSFTDFATRGLGLMKYAQLIVPGGPVFLTSNHPPYHDERSGACSQLFFIVDTLRIERVHLIQHDHCAFYLQVVGVTPENLRDRQIEDLRTGADRLAGVRPNVSIHRWVAGVDGKGVHFSAV